MIPRVRILNVGEKLGDAELLWLRMLQCIPGISAAKAAAVAESFPSLGSLLKAYEGCCDEAARIALLEVGDERGFEVQDKFGGSSRQRQLSRKVYEWVTMENGSLLL